VCSNLESRGVKLNSTQLDILWKLDFELAHKNLGLPKRTCTAKPVESWGETMESAAFQKLKDQVIRMWLRASLCFEVYLDEHHGWGLRVNNHHEGNLWVIFSYLTQTELMKTIPYYISILSFVAYRSITNSSNMKDMGWIAHAPSNKECPTGHRYLRSPISTSSYLGGPISLANWAPNKKSTVKCCAHVNCDKSGKYHLTTKRPLAPLTPVLWNYGFDGETTFPLMPLPSEWKLVSNTSLNFYSFSYKRSFRAFMDIAIVLCL